MGSGGMSMPREAYNPLVRELFFSARQADDRPPQGAEWITGAAGSIELGTWVRFALCLESGRVTEARFKAYGCPHTLAAAASLAGSLRGRVLDELLAEGVQELFRRLEVPPEKLGRLLIVEDALRACQRRFPRTV